MSKPFFEVFPTLKVKDDIQMMFQGVEVTKVSTTYLRSRTPAKTAAVCQKSYPGVGKRAV